MYSCMLPLLDDAFLLGELACCLDCLQEKSRLGHLIVIALEPEEKSSLSELTHRRFAYRSATSGDRFLQQVALFAIHCD